MALYGGAGSIYGTLIGTIITETPRTGLVLPAANANWPELVEGLIIIFVVSIGIGINNRVAKARGVPRFFRGPRCQGRAGDPKRAISRRVQPGGRPR